MFDPGTATANDAGLSPLAAFLWAAGGSLALELISLFNEIKAERAAGLPRYYKSFVFWMVRLGVTAVAGALAVAEGASRPILAVNIGASAPAILQLLAKPPQSG
jgi:hypothetical protein